MESGTAWLSSREEHLWRGWVRLNAEINAALQRQMQMETGLSMADFEVLVHLTDAERGQVRVNDLAELLRWERSRVSHHTKRMEGRGLLRRTECAEDRRGAFIAITPSGRAAIENAAPGHVRAVRRLLFDALRPEEVAVLTGMVDKLLSHSLDESPGSPR